MVTERWGYASYFCCTAYEYRFHTKMKHKGNAWDSHSEVLGSNHRREPTNLTKIVIFLIIFA